MPIIRTPIIHEGPGGLFEGMAVFDGDWAEPRPGVLVLPNVLGTKEADFIHAEQLAGLGYAAFVGDVYGQGRRATRQSPDPAQYMNEMNADRGLLRERLWTALAQLKAMPQVDAARTAAIGYCFGGKCVLDLARSGADLLGGVSFHGVYDRPDYANVSPMAVKLLICHGWDDPLAPPEATVALASELTEGGADWQLHAYGHAGHAFTDQGIDMRPERAVFYEPKADRRSWQAMANFLEELFA